MNSWPNRLNNVVCFAFSVLGVMTALCWLSGQFMGGLNSPTDGLIVRNIRMKVAREFYSFPKAHQANMKLKMDIDTTPLFDWSVKEIFLYVVAEYSTKTHPVNQVIIYDSIIMNEKRSRKHIKIESVGLKYPLIGLGQDLI
eukprot:Ihof_evm10s25 gene=Ihof_evmTU10s25